MAYLFLILAIIAEVCATLSLRMATHNGKAWYGAVAVGYVTAFAMLSVTLTHGLGLGIAYGIWAAGGVALTAIASKLLFEETFNKVMAMGIGLIIVGVLLIELGAAH